MNQHDAQSAVTTALYVVEHEFCRGAGFTEAEWRRLVFLRWLYRTGRLTEWAGAADERVTEA
jgi:hypothetical protein